MTGVVVAAATVPDGPYPPPPPYMNRDASGNESTALFNSTKKKGFEFDPDLENGVARTNDGDSTFQRKNSREKYPAGPLGSTSHFFVKEVDPDVKIRRESVDDTMRQFGLPTERLVFLRKVYGILSLQFTVTVLISCLFTFSNTLRLGLINNGQAVLISVFVVSLVSLITLFCLKNVYPVNYILFSLFTIAMSLDIAVVSAVYYENGLGVYVLMAAFITLSIFLSLTIVAWLSGIDFSFLGGFLSVCLSLLIVVSLFSMATGFRLGYLWSVFGALVFCGYILFDTQMIISRYGYDDVLLASIELYLDILNLFLYILQILKELKH